MRAAAAASSRLPPPACAARLPLRRGSRPGLASAARRGFLASPVARHGDFEWQDAKSPDEARTLSPAACCRPAAACRPRCRTRSPAAAIRPRAPLQNSPTPLCHRASAASAASCRPPPPVTASSYRSASDLADLVPAGRPICHRDAGRGERPRPSHRRRAGARPRSFSEPSCRCGATWRGRLGTTYCTSATGCACRARCPRSHSRALARRRSLARLAT